MRSRLRFRPGFGLRRRIQGNFLLPGTGDIINIIPSQRIQHIEIVSTLHDVVVFIKEHCLSLPVLLDAEISSEANAGKQDHPHEREYENHHAIVVTALAGNLRGIFLQSLQPFHEDFLIELKSLHLLPESLNPKLAVTPFPAEMFCKFIHPELQLFKLLRGCSAAYRIALGILSHGTSGGQCQGGTGHAGSGNSGGALGFFVLIHQCYMTLAVIGNILAGIILNHHVRTGNVSGLHRSAFPVLLSLPDSVVFGNNVIPAGFIFLVEPILFLIPLLLLRCYCGNLVLFLRPGKLQIRKFDLLYQPLVERLSDLFAAFGILQSDQCLSGDLNSGIGKRTCAAEGLGIKTENGSINLIRIQRLIIVLGILDKAGK